MNPDHELIDRLMLALLELADQGVITHSWIVEKSGWTYKQVYDKRNEYLQEKNFTDMRDQGKSYII